MSKEQKAPPESSPYGAFWAQKERYWKLRKKNVLIDYEKLQWLAGSRTYEALKRSHQGWITEYAGNGVSNWEEQWTDSIAVGSRPFVDKVKGGLGFRAKGRRVIEGVDGYQLRERPAGCKARFGVKNLDMGPKNRHHWDVNTE